MTLASAAFSAGSALTTTGSFFLKDSFSASALSKFSFSSLCFSARSLNSFSDFSSLDLISLSSTSSCEFLFLISSVSDFASSSFGMVSSRGSVGLLVCWRLLAAWLGVYRLLEIEVVGLTRGLTGFGFSPSARAALA